MISLSASGGSITFTFSGNSGYLQDGVITVPVNSLTLVTDNSEMFTFKKSATNDIFISGLYSEIGMTKAELESFYKANMVGSTGGGGGITSGEVQSMIDSSISGKVNTSDNIVSGASIMYEFASGDTTPKNVYNNGIRVNEFYVKYANNASVSDAAAWFTTRISNNGGFPYSNIGMTVDASDYAITNVVSTTGDITTTLEDGVVKVTLPEGYYVVLFVQSANFQIYFEKYNIASGQTADVINDFLNDSIQDIYDEIPKTYLTEVKTYLDKTTLTVTGKNNDGTQKSSGVAFGDSISGKDNKIDVYFAGGYYNREYLNTGTSSYSKIPSQPISTYANGYAYMVLGINTGYTGNTKIFDFTVGVINKYNAVTSANTFSYNKIQNQVIKTGGYEVNVTLSGNNIYVEIGHGYASQYRILYIQAPVNTIIGYEAPSDVKSNFLITNVEGYGYIRKGQEVIDDLYSSKASTSQLWNAINQSTSGKVDTTAITTSVTSASTDSQIPSAKAVYDTLGGLKLIRISQNDYDALTTKDADTLYFIGDSTGYTMKIGDISVS